MTSEYAHVIFNLFAVLALVFITAYCLKKLKLARQGSGSHINILEIVPIGTKEKIMLVEVNGAYILVGATASHVEMLHVFDRLEIPAQQPKIENKTFLTMLNKFRTKAVDKSLG